jgi:histone deacetylase 1/2
LTEEHPDQDKSKQYCFKVTRALYGTIDAPKLWNDELSNTLIELGYIRLKSDWNIFTRQTQDKPISIIAFHVDDGIISASDSCILNELVIQLKKKYKVKVHDGISDYLKIQFKQEGNYIYMHQKDYITEAAIKFKVIDAKPVSVPMDPGFVTRPEPKDTPFDNNTIYRSIIGCLLHIARQTRPDILLAVNLLSSHLVHPMERHWRAAKRVLIYLYHTRHESLRIGPYNEAGLVAYSDATWADDPETRLSRTGGVIFYNGSFISAHSHQQRSISLSATQAEYQALSSSVQEILYFRTLLQEIGYKTNIPTPLMCDNQGALYLAVSTKNHPKIKHIAIRYHFIRDAIHKDEVKLIYVPTQNQIADMFTKPLPPNLFQKFKREIGIHAWEDDTKLKNKPAKAVSFYIPFDQTVARKDFNILQNAIERTQQNFKKF